MEPLESMEIGMSLRARLLQRPRLRWILAQTRRRLSTLWTNLLTLFFPCCRTIRKEESSPVMASSPPAAQPIESLEDLRARTLLLSPNLEFLRSSVGLRNAEVESKRPRLLVCHDFKGGYQEDKWVQGTRGAQGYVLWHWHLVDVFVYFSHSLVTVPPPGWINAAHKHGVPVLGTFITEWAHGASVCRSLLASAEICCMYASRLAEVALEFGFDGWLINIENEVDQKDLPRLHLFVQHLRQCMHSQSPNSYVIWYDAVTEDGTLDWQNCLNEKNRFFFGDSDGLFTNYRWQEDMAESSARGAGERAHEVYMGVDVFGRNTFGGGEWNCDKALKVARKAQVSAALFAPGWVYETNQPPSFEAAQNRWWRTIEDCWPVGRSSPLRLPFFTDFNRGCGARVSVEGNEVSSQPWFNLSCQNLQPILKVAAQPPNSLEVNLSHERAFSGGSCLRISASQDTLGVVLLYSSHIPVKGNQFHVSHSVQTPENLNICLALHIQTTTSKLLVLLSDEEEEEEEEAPPPSSPCCIIKRASTTSRNNKWVVRQHTLELGAACTITQIHAVAYSSHTFDVQNLTHLFNENHQLGESHTHSQDSLLGHLRIATDPGHDRALPEIIFEGCHPECIPLSETLKAVNLTLRWGLFQRRVVPDGECQWMQYHVYVTRDGLSPRELLGVAMAQAFVVHELVVASSCDSVEFRVQAQCVCGLLGALSEACEVDVSRREWSSGSDPSQLPLLSEDVV